jgi:hypothetical protein
VYYRAAGGFSISPLRYAFPEWTACQHVGAPRDFNGVNAAVMLGAVVCVEPDAYQASLGDPIYEDLARYIQESERIRAELRDTIFCGDYFDTLDVTVTEVNVVPSPSAATKPAAEAGGVVVPAAEATFQPVHSGAMHYRVHGHKQTGRRAVVVCNSSLQERTYTWKFTHKDVAGATLQEPFEPARDVRTGDGIRIKPERFHVLCEK